MLVSVIIPTYNRAEMLKEAIESALMQTYLAIELIVVDDGSSDNTHKIIEVFKDRIKRICIQNSGVSHARNVGIKASKGEFIAFLDSDDLWLKDKVQVQIDYFKSHSSECICQTEEIWIRNGKRVNPKNIHKKYSGQIFEKCIPLCIVSPSAVMIRRKVFEDIGCFDEKMPACEDYDLWLRSSLKYNIITLDQALIIKRGGHEDQLSRQSGLDIWRIYSLEKLLKEQTLDDNRRNLVINNIIARCKIVAQGAGKRENKEMEKKYLEIMKRMKADC